MQELLLKADILDPGPVSVECPVGGSENRFCFCVDPAPPTRFVACWLVRTHRAYVVRLSVHVTSLTVYMILGTCSCLSIQGDLERVEFSSFTTA